MADINFSIEDPGRPRRSLPGRTLRPSKVVSKSAANIPINIPPLPDKLEVPAETQDVLAPANSVEELDAATGVEIASSEIPAPVPEEETQIYDATSEMAPSPGTASLRTSPSEMIRFAVFSVLLVAYAFNVDNVDTGLGHLLGSQFSEGPPAALLQAVPYLTLLPVVLMFYGVATSLATIIGLRRRRRRPRASRGRRRDPLDLFKTQAQDHGISMRTAFACFHLLERYVPETSRLQLHDRMEVELGMTPAQVRTARLQLMETIGRDADPGARLAMANTVLQMMSAAQSAPRVSPATVKAPVHLPGDPRMVRRVPARGANADS